MRNSRVILLSISFGVLLGGAAIAQAASNVKLSWSIPTTRENGQALAASELTGYALYYTTDDPSVTGTINVSGGSTSTYTVQNLAAGNYHFAMSAIDVAGQKSKLSAVADITVAVSTAAPSAPSSEAYNILSTSVATGLKSINVSWVAPITRTDGTRLSVSELSGYRIVLFNFATTAVNTVVQGGSANSYAMQNIKAGQYILTVAAIDNSGRTGTKISKTISIQ